MTLGKYVGSNTRQMLSLIAVVLLLKTGYAQNTSIRNHHLEIQVNNSLQTMVVADFPGSRPLMNSFANSERLETKYFTTKVFSLVKKTACC